MKQSIVSIALIFSAAVFSNTHAQQTPPPGAGDTDLRDTDVKRRSLEMERIERDAKTKEKTPGKSAKKNEEELAVKYAEIKTDYEKMQLSQDAVIKVYQARGKIDYAQIGTLAGEINKSARRLNSNLFPLPRVENPEAKKDNKEANENETEIIPKSMNVKDLIVELDNSIAGFVTSPMFRNLRAIDAEAAGKARLELEKIIALSALLSSEARKLEIAATK